MCEFGLRWVTNSISWDLIVFVITESMMYPTIYSVKKANKCKSQATSSNDFGISCMYMVSNGYQ